MMPFNFMGACDCMQILFNQLEFNRRPSTSRGIQLPAILTKYNYKSITVLDFLLFVFVPYHFPPVLSEAYIITVSASTAACYMYGYSVFSLSVGFGGVFLFQMVLTL